MVLTKEDFSDLTVCELLQNAWCYSETIIERGDKTKQLLFDYLRYCEEDLEDKWCDQLPDLNFVLKKIKSQKVLFNPGAPANADNYMNFLCRFKIIERVISLKRQLKGVFVLV